MASTNSLPFLMQVICLRFNFSILAFIPLTIAIISLPLNIIVTASTFVWQRKLTGRMAEGYNESKINLLNSTNRIRTIAFLAEGIIAVVVIINAVK